MWGRAPEKNPFLSIDRFHDHVAVVDGGKSCTYGDLLDRADRFSLQLGSGRHLIFLQAQNSLEGIISLLGCLRAGHVVFLFGEGDSEKLPSLIEAYDPNWNIEISAEGEANFAWRHARQIDLNDDLCLLLSTSGSTGSPKFVKLSYKNIRSNANAIAEYLGITPSDRAATTLKYHYSYGLSVVTSHLFSGASLAMTDESVSAPDFWTWFAESGATSFAGVPYVFEMLDRNQDFAAQAKLRYVTQAGGKLAANLVSRMAALGRKHGWTFFVMYGQTEASPRMAYLPPHLAEAHPDCIGIAIPGGELSLLDESGLGLDACDTPGELIYRGDNIMLGYAQRPEDLATDATPAYLPTGDIAVRTADGLFRIVGRASRFVKPYGVRISLDDVQAQIQSRAPGAWATGTDEKLIVALDADTHPDADALRQWISSTYSLPAFAITLLAPQRLPCLANGKPDYQELIRQAACLAPIEPGRVANKGGDTDCGSVSDIFTALTGAKDVNKSSTFLTLAADSLSYVITSLAIEDYLGHLPADWDTMSVEALEAVKGRPPSMSTRPLHFLHSARVLLLLLGIPFHASMWFVTAPIVMISAPRHSVVANILYSSIHSFRMFAFYFISGYFGALILRRLPASAWMSQQLKRICLPIIAGAIVLTPLEMAAIAVAPGRSGPGPLDFWLRCLTSPGEYWLSTRWFLATLLGVVILMAFATFLYRSTPVGHFMKKMINRLEEHPRISWATGLLVVGFFSFSLAASSRVLHGNVLLFGSFEWRSIFYYAPAYALGVVMWMRPTLFDRFLDLSPIDWGLAFAAFGILTCTGLAASGIWLMINKLIWVPSGLLISRAFLSAMYRYANRPHPWIAKLIDASFVIYIWHIVFVLGLNDAWFALALPPSLAIAMSSVGAFAASWMMYLVIRRSELLSFAFNGGLLRSA